MSKGPTPRHSKSPKPVTIDLDATDVTPKHEPAASRPTGPSVAKPAAETKPDEKASPAAAASPAADSGAKTTGEAKPAGDPKSGADAKAAGDAKPASDAKSGQPSAGAATADPKPAAPNQTAAPAGKASPPPGRSGGGFGMVASGLIGAVIALGGGYALQTSGMLPAPGGGGNDQIAALSSKLDTLSSSVEGLTGRVDETSASTDIPAKLSARLDSLETAVAAGGSAADSTALDALQGRLATVEQKLAALPEGTGAADPQTAAAVSELRAAQSGLQTSVSELKSLADALSGRIATLEQDQASLSEKLAEPGRQIDLARAIAAAGLKSAIDRGTSFMSELEAFASVAPNDPAVPELRDLAARGVPSRSKLIEEFPAAADKAIAAAAPPNPDEGLMNRLMSSAMSVVKVRKVGDVEGDSAEAIAARAEARLMDGDIDAALAEWNTLPEASRTAASDFGDALAARARAEKLIAAAMAPVGSSAAPAN